MIAINLGDARRSFAPAGRSEPCRMIPSSPTSPERMPIVPLVTFLFNHPEIILGWALSGVCMMILVFWGIAALVVRSARKAMPEVEAGLAHDFDASTDSAPPKVSIIIPAHNEEDLIDEALESMRRSRYPSLEIIVVADRCTDRTVEIARGHAASDARVRVIEMEACPDGWSGKCHSCYHGYLASTGGLLLFTDADTLFDPDLVRASVGLMEMRGLDFLSLLGRLRFDRDFENTAQPVAAMSLMRMYPIDKANRADPARRRPFANGQFMLFRRDAYEAVGTHEQVKNAILEDLRFARRLARHGRTLGLTLSGPLFLVRMYETIEEFRRGWKRIFIEAANRHIPRLRIAAWRLRALALSPFVAGAAVFFGLLVWPVDWPLALATGALGAAALAVEYLVLRRIYNLLGAPLKALRRFPIGCLHVASILAEAADDLKHHRGIEWAKIHYDVKSREEPRRRPHPAARHPR